MLIVIIQLLLRNNPGQTEHVRENKHQPSHTQIAFFFLMYGTTDRIPQVKGKAAIDGLGSRLGKSGASFLQQGLILAFGNILRAAPLVAGAKPRCH